MNLSYWLNNGYFGGTYNSSWRANYQYWWASPWICVLIWNGIVEVLAIAAVYVTDSDLLRAIGGFSMILSNAAALSLTVTANHYVASAAFTPAVILHSIGLGQAIDTFILTFIINGDGEIRQYFNFFNCLAGKDLMDIDSGCW